jgi:hypothetical protein
LKKLPLVASGIGLLAALVVPSALASGGAQTIAAAPTLPVGVRVGHAYTLPGCTGYGEIWRLGLARGDQLVLDYGSKDRNGVQILLLDPKATDNSNSDTEVLTTGWTTYRDDIAYDATKTGRYTIIVKTYYPCQNTIWYFMTAHVRHAAKR